MGIYHEPRMMPEFHGEDIDDDTECYMIIQYHDDETDNSQLEEYIYEKGYTKSEVNQRMRELEGAEALQIP